jgi:predicted Zn-dependent protease
MKKLLIPLLLALTATSVMQGQDALINTLRQELNRNYQVLKEQPVPAYYISLRYQETTNLSCQGRMGHLINTTGESTPSRTLTPLMRVGSRELDNSHEIRGSGSWSASGGSRQPAIPEDFNPTVLKRNIWNRLDQLYNSSCQQFEKVKANLAVKVEQEDKSADFTDDKPEKYYEKPLQKDALKLDLKTLESKARKYSAVFNSNDDLIEGFATVGASTTRKIFIDTEGREIAENQIIYNIQLQAETQAEDGMRMPLVKTWFASAVSEMPSDDEVVKAAGEMSALLSELKKAPVAESFTGPALLAPAAAGVFFHEIFGHRIEGARLKQESDAQTFKKKVNEEVLPAHLSVTFDPSKKYYGKTALNGYYAFDDEGIRGQKVEVVKNGVLRSFLMSRTPIDGFAHSNGHGRGAPTATPVTRQSNMFVESAHTYSEADLIKLLKEECKKQGKEFAFYFKEVSGGFTQTGRVMPNAFNITPLLVYRIFPDGRPDELVRGVDLVGTPLAMFAQIEACSKDKGIFNGFCGAESGSVPVATVAPALLVKTIETQKKGKSQNKQIILPKPTGETKSVYNEPVLDAIKAETDRELSDLALPGLKPPFFISSSIADVQITTVNATNGSLVSSGINRMRPFNYRLLVGDYQRTDENFQSMVGQEYNTTMSLDDTPEAIRYSLWRAYDGIYKATAEIYAQKEAAINRFNVPPKDLELPDWDKTPVVVMTDKPAPLSPIDRTALEKYVKDVSAIFSDYPDIIESNVAINNVDYRRYFYNTEQSATQSAKRIVLVYASARTLTEGGEELNRLHQIVVGDVSSLPPVAEMQKRCRQFAETVIEERNAGKIDETYIGPVLFEKEDVVSPFYDLFFLSGLEASRRLLTSQGSMFSRSDIEELVGKRVAAKTITIEDMSGTPEYNGVKLLGAYSVDAQAVVPPKQLTLVEKGILKNLLSDRTPTLAVPHSNGHALTNVTGNDMSVSTGVVRLTCSVTKPYNALKDTLLKLAAEEGYDYAFIVKNGNGFYRINVADGAETRIRSAEFQDFNRNSFKKVTAVSDNEQIYNGLGKMSNAISVIIPDAMLFEDIQIRFTRNESLTKPPIVPRD